MAKGDSGEMQKSLDTAGQQMGAGTGQLSGSTYKPDSMSFDPVTKEAKFTPGGTTYATPNGAQGGNFLGQNATAQTNLSNATAQNSNDYNTIMGQYQNTANNGGFTDQNIQDLRSRAQSPIRATYQNAQADMDRQRAIQGGYSPNYMAASAKMARGLGQSMADAGTNANAGIAQMQQQGKLYGLAGMQGLYGTTPGMSNMYGNQLAQSNQNLLGNQGLVNQSAQTYLNGKFQQSQIPGDFQQAMGNIGTVAKTAGGLVSPFSMLGGLGSSGSSNVGSNYGDYSSGNLA